MGGRAFDEGRSIVARLLSIGLVALLLLGASGCTSGNHEPPRGDPLDPVDAFPQVRNSYMRQ